MTETISIPTAAAPSKGAGPSSTLGWALFLGMSWTWCIGMFAPVLLVRDYGLIAWFIFAIPNVVGAAAMGWVLARPGAADRVAWSHRGAGVFFSIVTIAFHGFFIDWIIRGLVGWIALALTPVLALAMVLVGRARRWADLALAGAVFLFSVGAIVAYGINADGFTVAAEARAGSALELAALSAASVFGFALCPYLDLTFLRARQATAPRAAASAFTLGFGAFFLLMIVLTRG